MYIESPLRTSLQSSLTTLKYNMAQAAQSGYNSRSLNYASVFNNAMTKATVEMAALAPLCGANYRGPTNDILKAQAQQPLNMISTFGITAADRARDQDTSDYFAGYLDANCVWEVVNPATAGSTTPRDVQPNPRAFNGTGWNWAMFPVVFNHNVPSQSKLYRTVIPYICIVSSSPWSQDTSLSSVLPQTRPNYVKLPSATTWRPAQAGGQPQPAEVYVDATYLTRNDDSYLAIAASVRACIGRWASPACYVTIAPYISADAYEAFYTAADTRLNDGARTLSPRNVFSFGGASCGLAVAAAMMGLPNIMYTGYLSSFGTNRIATEDLNPDNSAVAQVFVGANMVENIDEVPSKVWYACTNGIGLCIPLNNTWHRQDMARAIDLAVQQVRAYRPAGGGPAQPTRLAGVPGIAAYDEFTKLGQLMPMRNNVWSAQMRTSGNSSFFYSGSYIMPCVNVSDMVLLSCSFASYMYSNVQFAAARRAVMDSVGAAIKANIATALKKKVATTAVSRQQAADRKAAGIKAAKNPPRVPTARNIGVSKKAHKEAEKAARTAQLVAHKAAKEAAATAKAAKKAAAAAAKAGLNADASGSAAGVMRLPKAVKNLLLESLGGGAPKKSILGTAPARSAALQGAAHRRAAAKPAGTRRSRAEPLTTYPMGRGDADAAAADEDAALAAEVAKIQKQEEEAARTAAARASATQQALDAFRAQQGNAPRRGRGDSGDDDGPEGPGGSSAGYFGAAGLSSPHRRTYAYHDFL
jgi:hypothetical protein